MINEKSVGKYSSVSEGDIIIGIDTNLTDELIQEGVVRDLIRNIQNFRKEADFNVEDRINIIINASSTIENAIKNFKEYFCNEVLANKLTFGAGNGEFTNEITINNDLISVSLTRN